MVDDCFTATDALLLDVEMVERWAVRVVHDGDAPTSALVNIVTRLRSTADTLADYLFRTSKPAKRRERVRARRVDGRHAPRLRPGKTEAGAGTGFGRPPAGRAERARAERARSPDGQHQGKTPHDGTA